MKNIILATALVATIVASALSAQANTVKYDNVGKFDAGRFFENLERGG